MALGLYSTTAPADVAESIYAATDLTGVFISLSWAIIEPSQGTYDWTTLNEQIAALPVGAKICIGVATGLANAPAWLPTLGGVATATVTVALAYHTSPVTTTLAYPGSAPAVGAFIAMMTALQAQLTTVGAISQVTAFKFTLYGGFDIETAIPWLTDDAPSTTNALAWAAAGYLPATAQSTYFAALSTVQALFPSAIISIASWKTQDWMPWVTPTGTYDPSGNTNDPILLQGYFAAAAAAYPGFVDVIFTSLDTNTIPAFFQNLPSIGCNLGFQLNATLSSEAEVIAACQNALDIGTSWIEIHWQYIQDYPGVVAAIAALSPQPPSGGITLATPSVPYAFLPVSVNGIDNQSTPASAMNVQLGTLGVWQGLFNFAGAPSTGEGFSGIGPRLEPGTYLMRLQNATYPSILSNVVTFTTNVLLPQTFLISGDLPDPVAPPAQTAFFGPPLAQPPTNPGSPMDPTAAGVFGIQGASGPLEEGWDCNLWSNSDTAVTFTNLLEVEWNSTGGTASTTTVSLVGLASGTFTTFQVLGESSAQVGITYYAYQVDEYVRYAITATGQGTIALGTGASRTTNVGYLGIGWQTSDDLFGHPHELSAAVNSPYDQILQLNQIPVWPAAVPITLTGSNTAMVLATGMDVNIDYAQAASPFALEYARVTSFTGAVSNGGNFTAVIPGLAAGVHAVTVRDHNIPLLESNTISITVGGAAIVLAPITAAANTPAPIGGVDYESPPATAMQYQVNGAGPWVDVPLFQPAAEYGFFWGGLGPSEPPGTYTLEVRNTSLPDVVSNPVTYVIPVAPTDESCCVPQLSSSLGRYRAAIGINWNGLTLFGDAYSGVVGQASFDTFLEYGNTMRAQVATPIIHKDRRRIFIPRFELDVESGVGQPECCGFDPVWMLDWSKDGGRTWSAQQIFRSMGKLGEYTQRLRWLKLGQGRQWIFRIQSTDPVRRTIIGTYIDSYQGLGTSSQ